MGYEPRVGESRAAWEWVGNRWEISQGPFSEIIFEKPRAATAAWDASADDLWIPARPRRR